MNRRYKQGIFKPNNPSKYKGNVNNIIFRSGWENKILRRFDNDPSILEYSSEEVVIPYKSPVDGKVHRYFVDFYIKYITKTNLIKEALIEVKPSKQTVPPKVPKKMSQRFLKEAVTYEINNAKWIAASAYCKSKGWDFLIFTEKEINV